MGIKLIRNGSGNFCPTWFARFTRNGQKVDRALTVKLRGKVPTTDDGQWDRTAKGDAVFEESRRAAEKAFRALVRGEGNQRREIKKAETTLLALAGKKTDATPLSRLGQMWKSIERNKKPTALRVKIAEKTFASFALFADTFAREHGFRCSTLEGITPDMAKAYFAKLTSTFAWETAKGKYSLLRNAWKRWAKQGSGANPFGAVIVRKGQEDAGRISRVPLTADEARRLFEIVREKRPTLYPLLVCAATTGLRLGDAVSLKWADVHLERNKDERKRGNYGTIGGAMQQALETKKTGARVILPIIQPFADVLLEMEKRRDDRDVYLFPAELERYNHVSTSKNGEKNYSQRSGLIREIKPFFALAVSPDAARAAIRPAVVDEGGEEVSPTLKDVLAAISRADFEPGKRNRLEAVARAHFSGQAAHFIAKDLDLARSQVSDYLRDLEDLTGARFRAETNRRRKLDLEIDRRTLIDRTRVAKPVRRKAGQDDSGPVRKHAASIYGWHSLRATYVVLAAEAGVPLAFIEKAVGHSTVEMTLQYFNPTGKHIAGMMGKRLARTFALGVRSEPPAAQPPAAALTADSVLSALSEDEKKKLLVRLLDGVKGAI